MPTLAASLLSSAALGGAFCDDSSTSPSSTSCALRKRAIYDDDHCSGPFVQQQMIKRSYSPRSSRCADEPIVHPQIHALVEKYDLSECARRPSVDLGAPVWVPEAWSFVQPKELKRKRDEEDWVNEMLENPTTKKSRLSVSSSWAFSSDFDMTPIAEEDYSSSSSAPCTPSFLFPYVDYAQEEEHHPDPALELTTEEQFKDRETLVLTYAQELEKLASAWSSFKGFLPNVKDLISILNEKDVLLNAIAEADPNNVKDCNMLFKLLFVQTQHIVFYREFLESILEDSELDEDLNLDSVCASPAHMEVEVTDIVNTPVCYSSDFSCSFEKSSEKIQKTSSVPSRFAAPQALAEHVPSVDCELGPMMTCDWTIVENYTY